MTGTESIADRPHLQHQASLSCAAPYPVLKELCDTECSSLLDWNCICLTDIHLENTDSPGKIRFGLELIATEMIFGIYIHKTVPCHILKGLGKPPCLT